ncbi:metallophosphoesterase [Exiguobacterium sp. SH5S4]|uniref:metallophosphoesterase family protein n=1 Tax=Exiguobacterium sp. SH5S4 TaxID=2510961 RepID=UPI0013757B1A|nr:metallophosphoesterase [Exiguobacterium sp. SH5S4]
MIEIKRLSDETEQDYFVRICSNKDQYGLSWVEVGQILNEEFGKDHGESKWRKKYAAFQEGMRYAEDKSVSFDDLTAELEIKRRELEKEKIRVQDQRRIYKGYVRDEARVEEMKANMLHEIRLLAQSKPLIQEDFSVPVVSEREGLTVFSDWHFGTHANNAWNKFDNNVFFERVAYLKNRVIQHGIENGIERLHVAVLGDMISGLIHQTIRIENTENVSIQTMRVGEVLAEVVNELSEHFSIDYYCVRGNHDRITPQKDLTLSSESFMDIIHWYVKARLENNARVTFHENQIDEELCEINICGDLVYGVHGHKDRPNNVVENLTLMTGRKPAAVLLGHRHHHFEKEVHGVDIIQNGTLSGVDEFAKDIRATSIPHQKFMVWERELGRLCTYNLRFN